MYAPLCGKNTFSAQDKHLTSYVDTWRQRIGNVDLTESQQQRRAFYHLHQHRCDTDICSGDQKEKKLIKTNFI